jgi:hypothetical protein
MKKKIYQSPTFLPTVINTSDVLTESGDGFDGPSHGFFEIDDIIVAPKEWF